jgi:hypothetical protein
VVDATLRENFDLVYNNEFVKNSKNKNSKPKKTWNSVGILIFQNRQNLIGRIFQIFDNFFYFLDR